MVEVHTPSITNLDDHNEQEPREECGVYGVWAPGEEVSKLTYFGLFALQHRGQEAAGIAVGDDDRIVVFKDMGLVANIFDESTLSALQGNVAVGHTRYSTAGGKEWSNVQPMFSTSSTGVDIALGHNGNLVNYLELREEAVQRGLIKPHEESVSDSMCLSMLLADGVDEDTSVFDSARDFLPRVKGAFCLTFTDGHTMYAARDPHGVRPLVLGRLAREYPAEGADLVIPVPESGNPAAVGYARESGITFAHGLVKNAYVGRTFIQPTQTLRQLGIRLKLNPLREVINGKKLVVVDDSIVRGNTQRALIRMLREAGAAEVHVRIASPPVKWPCFYGIDFASPGELIANASPSDDPETVCATICDTIGADSLGFVSIEEMVAATEQPRSELCTACFSGEYPLGLPAGNSNADAVRTLLGTE